METNKPTIIITGASSGIGKNLALKYSKRDVQLVLGARSSQKLQEVADQCRKNGSEVTWVVVDVQKEQDCKKLIEITIKKYRKINLLILNAGVSYHSPFEQVKDLSLYKTLMEVNFFGYMYCTYFAIPYLRATKGQIGVIGSLSGEIGLPFRSGYCASKFAVKGFFESLRAEIPSEEITITVISPPSVNTEMRIHSLKSSGDISFNEDDQQKMSVEECTDLIMDALDKKQKDVILTFGGKVGVMMKPFFPSLVEYFAKRKAGGVVASKL